MIVQIVTILAVVALTYIFLQLLGSRPKNIFLTLEERQRWNTILASKIGPWLYMSNLAATLTSLATVYVFFLGSSSLFGRYIYISAISIVVGALVTVKLTERLISTQRFSNRISTQNISTVAITSLFWSNNAEGKAASKIARVITLCSILCILWLEFATFAILAASVFNITGIEARAVIIFLAVLFVFDFTLRNGLRGFIFTDLLHAPLIVIGIATVLLGAATIVFSDHSVSALASLVAEPKLPLPEVTTFIIATIFLNAFILLTSESHWLRVWAMRDHVRRSTLSGSVLMAITWLMLIATGLLIAATIKGVGTPTVVELVQNLDKVSPIFVVGFWMAATAALYSTADTQLYSFLLVAAFDNETGQVSPDSRIAKSPLISAVVISIFFSAAYVAVAKFDIPFEQIVFFIFPIFLCLVPSLVELLKRQTISPGPMIASISLYLLCGLGMILLPKYSFFFSLGAPLMPAIVAVFVAVRR